MKTLSIIYVLLFIALTTNGTYCQTAGSISFNGSTGYVALPSNSSLISFADKITIEAWVKLSSGGSHTILASGNENEYSIAIHSDGKIGVTMVAVNPMLNHEFISSSSITFGTWNHIAITYDGAIEIIYINGTLNNSIAETGNVSTTYTENISIGAYTYNNYTNHNSYTNGLIDEVRVWNIARSQTDIQNNMHNELLGTESGLVGYWKFNENSGSTTYDATTNHNDGTLSSGVSWSTENPLPVELTSFIINVINKNIYLYWTTATEVNNFGFDIECKSMNSWNKVGFVEGHGTTNVPQSYSYVDKFASEKVSYRLKQIDRDGKFEYSKTVEVANINTPKIFSLSQNYPNPFNPTTVISYQLPITNHASLKVYDAIGREVATLVNEVKDAGRYSVTFNASELSSGLYFARFQSGYNTMVKKMQLMK